MTLIYAVAPFAAVFVLKLLLDLRAAHFLVKYFFWVPLRNYFREKPVSLSGEWEHLWGAGGSAGFAAPVDRHGHTMLRQLGSYCYAEFYSQGIRYAFFGQIKGGYWVGEWFDVQDQAGYYGAFHVEIVSSKQMRGLWLGHSKTNRDIRSDSTEWKRVGG